MSKIDLDRGVIIRNHSSGMQVYMYADTPGVFLNANEIEVGNQIAHEAGYDVPALARARQKREAMAAALAAVEAEFDDGSAGAVLEERNGYRLVARGAGLFQIEDTEGSILTPRPLSEQEACSVFNKLAPLPSEEEDGDDDDEAGRAD